ncbi:MAG: heavy metal-binding domain-containing protein [Ignavibacteriaceae bacterium]
MKRQMSLSVSVFLICGVLFTGISFAQHKDSSNKQKAEHMKEMNMEQMKMADSLKIAAKKNSIVREGIIDLKAIDKNKDGKVYQDMMDYNVISDKPGTCPLCGMTLSEVSLNKAKENLLKNGYKVKK